MVQSFTTPPIDAQISQYELAIEQDPTINDHYWQLGICFLLQGNEEAAQSTWFFPMANAADDDEVYNLAQELGSAIATAARQQTKLQNFEAALLLRQHLQEVDNGQLENILEIILLSAGGGHLIPELVTELRLAEVLAETAGAAAVAEESLTIYQPLLTAAFSHLLTVLDEENVSIIMSCLDYSDRPEDLIPPAIDRGSVLLGWGWTELAIEIFEQCRAYQPDNFDILQYLSLAYSKIGQHDQSIAIAQHSYELAQTHSVQRQFKSSHTLMLALMEASEFAAIGQFIAPYREIVQAALLSYETDAFTEQPNDLVIEQCKTIMAFAISFFPYLEDRPAQTHGYLNQAGAICQKYLSPLPAVPVQTSTLAKPPGTLRIGYIAATLCAHSVGWLSRWLWHYHDRQQFQIFTYCMNIAPDNPINHQWFRDKSDATYYFDNDIAATVAQIRQDQIDILVDLDSITSRITYMVMAHKPAPVQVTWLGWDASGSPAIDYFIADSYVLPADAQAYYSEKIWRLPQTYVAVDGFEVGTPNLRRETLGIAPDAIVFFSAQIGYKLHPETVRLQLQILQQVPNSYLLVKARTQDAAVGDFYQAIATELGVDFGRLHFLGKVPDEATHRANLQIADVMLDSFPYNGATTTLETLWLGIPLVTLVGEQFAARNSYGFMMNVGVTEGIAWTAAEYVDWGIRLGTDTALRQQVMGKLLDARNTAPLWQGRQFTQEMEQAYQAMWNNYQAVQAPNS